jgi:hypothetical protein
MISDKNDKRSATQPKIHSSSGRLVVLFIYNHTILDSYFQALSEIEDEFRKQKLKLQLQPKSNSKSIKL